MSVSDFAHHPGRSLAATLAHWTDRIRSQRAGRAMHARVYGELAALSDRELSDIGIARSDIDDIAARAAAQTF